MPCGANNDPYTPTCIVRRALQVYGAFKRSAKRAKGGVKLSTVEAAILGSGASVAAQAVTTPLDVVRTRVMTATAGDRADAYEGNHGAQVNQRQGGEGGARGGGGGSYQNEIKPVVHDYPL